MKKIENIENVIARRCFNTDVAISLIKESMNKESLFARVACFRRLPRLWLAMRGLIFAVTFVLLLVQIGQASAGCNTSTGKDDDGAYCGSWACGDANSSITCTLSKGTLTISGTGNMQNYIWAERNNCNSCYPSFVKSDAPWAGKSVNKVVIEKGVLGIGNNAFVGESKITQIQGLENIKTIGESAFNRTSVTSFDLPNIEKIGNKAFHYIAGFQYIRFPAGTIVGENILTWHDGTNYTPYFQSGNTVVDGYNIYGSCGDKYVKYGVGCIAEEDCKDGYTIDRENKMCNKIAGCSSFADGACTCDEGYYTKAGGCVSADEGCGKYYYKKQNGCVSFEEGCGEGWLEKNRECIEASDGCGEGYKNMGRFCNRVRYTPAEAAKVLNEDNNTVTLTFKKQ